MTNIVVVRKEIITAVLKDTEYSAVFSEALKQNDGKLMIEILKKYCVGEENQGCRVKLTSPALLLRLHLFFSFDE